MEGNVFIGCSSASSLAYCPHCDYVYEYFWNGCNPFSEDPTCKKYGNFKDVVSEHHIEMHIEFARSLSHHEGEPFTDEHRKSFRKVVSNLNAIRRKFDAYREERDANRHRE